MSRPDRCVILRRQRLRRFSPAWAPPAPPRARVVAPLPLLAPAPAPAPPCSSSSLSDSPSLLPLPLPPPLSASTAQRTYWPTRSTARRSVDACVGDAAAAPPASLSSPSLPLSSLLSSSSCARPPAPPAAAAAPLPLPSAPAAAASSAAVTGRLTSPADTMPVRLCGSDTTACDAPTRRMRPISSMPGFNFLKDSRSTRLGAPSPSPTTSSSPPAPPPPPPPLMRAFFADRPAPPALRDVDGVLSTSARPTLNR
mmetsp:Transcript_11718/g.41034  ORF Transcript_11718/g.41034 Transcript_11718/m.41034 type:complete len:254 (-) Transcript_11718:37-798(-)